MVFKRIRELIGQPAKAINKARLYDQLMKSGDPVQARQTIPILVKYSRLMNNLFEDIRKLVPPGGTLRRVLYQGPCRSPTGTLYDAIGEVEVAHNLPTAVEPVEGSRAWSIRKTPEWACSSQPRRKSTGLDKSGRGQSPVRRTPDRSRTPDKSHTPVRRHTPRRETTFGKGKSRAHPSSPPKCMMLEVAPTTSRAASRAASHQESEIPLCSCPPESPTRNDPAQTPTSRQNPASQTPGDRTPRAEKTRDSENEVVPSPNMRRVLTRFQNVASPGASSLVGGLDANDKEKATPKKPRPS